MDGQVLMDTNEIISQAYCSSHKAIDLVGEEGSISDVIAFDDGIVEIVVNTVTSNRRGSRGTASYGNFVKIRHNNGMKTLYAHMEYGSVSVKAGDYVSKGQKIGRMGDTGNAYGVHLHFEVRQSNEIRVNPDSYLFGENNWTISKSNETTGTILNDNVSNEESLGETKVTFSSDKSLNLESDIYNYNKLKKTETNLGIDKSNPDNDISISSYMPKTNYEYGSIVDGLKSIGADSSFDSRTLIAYENGIHNYRGSYEQNIKLLNLLKQGKLKKAF